MCKIQAIQNIKIFIVRKKRLLAVAAAILAFLVLLVFVLVAAFLGFQQRSVEKQKESISSALEQEAQYLLAAAKEMDEHRVFDFYIQARDILNLISLATDERTKRNIGGILVADKEGTVLTRTRVVSQRGDYIFHTTAWGRQLAQGKDVAVVEKGGAWPLIVTGAVPLVRDGIIEGAIVAAHLVDNEYASRFGERYLSDGVKLAFYSREEGVVGDSFGDPHIQRVLSSSFHTGSDWIQNGRGGEHIVIGGKRYFVSNIVFPGIEASPGGLLVFSPSNVFWERTIDFSEPHFTIYNSTMRLEPSFGILDREFEHRVAIEILTGGEPINAAEAIVVFDPAKVRIADIITTRSFCAQNLFVEKEIDNEIGQVRIACLVPGGSGFTDSLALVAELLVQPLQEGRFDLLLSEGTKVLAHDGLGTDVLRMVTDGSYQVVAQPQTGEERVPRFLVFSPSHPNPARWYSTNTVRFTWLEEEGYSYRYAFGKRGDEPLKAGEIAHVNELRFVVEQDGMYELSITPFNGATVYQPSVYPVKVDATPPSAPEIRVSAATVKKGEIVRFEFAGQDALSGLQPTFYVRQNGSLLFPVGQRFDTAFQKQGTYTVTVRVFDNAGNYSDATQEIVVRK